MDRKVKYLNLETSDSFNFSKKKNKIKVRDLDITKLTRLAQKNKRSRPKKMKHVYSKFSIQENY